MGVEYMLVNETANTYIHLGKWIGEQQYQMPSAAIVRFIEEAARGEGKLRVSSDSQDDIPEDFVKVDAWHFHWSDYRSPEPDAVALQQVKKVLHDQLQKAQKIEDGIVETAEDLRERIEGLRKRTGLHMHFMTPEPGECHQCDLIAVLLRLNQLIHISGR